MSLEENRALVRHFFEEVWNKGSVAVADDVFADKYTIHAVGMNVETNAEGVKHAVGSFKTTFPDFRFDLADLIAEGDQVAVRWSAGGTQQGEFRLPDMPVGIPATGKQIKWTGVTIYRIADGKRVEAWDEPDRMGMMQQLGVIPAPGKGR